MLSRSSICVAIVGAGVLVGAGPAQVQAQNWMAAPTYGTIELSSGFTPDPYVESISAGGSDLVMLEGDGCAGYINESAPDLDLNYDAGVLPLYIYARGDSDLTLVVNDAAGDWHCSDDWQGTDPLIVFDNPGSGIYSIWVGTFYDEGVEPADVYISELSPDGEQEYSMLPDISAAPVYTTINLSAGFTPDPQSWDLQAGGSDEVMLDGPGCAGYINASAPDFDLNYENGSMPLYIYAQADTDLTLVINDPAGNWHCSDDEVGLNPGIRFPKPLSGNYNIWVGTFSDTDFQPATLTISELGFGG